MIWFHLKSEPSLFKQQEPGQSQQSSLEGLYISNFLDQTQITLKVFVRMKAINVKEMYVALAKTK